MTFHSLHFALGCTFPRSDQMYATLTLTLFYRHQWAHDNSTESMTHDQANHDIKAYK